MSWTKKSFKKHLKEIQGTGIRKNTIIVKSKLRKINGILVNSRNTKIKNIEGMRFNRLTAITYYASVGKERRAFWLFRCDCGIEKVLNRAQVEKGNVKSCSCLKKEKTKECLTLGLYNSYRYAAIKRELNFELSYDDFKKIIVSNCFYCNAYPANIRVRKGLDKGKKLMYSGVDRVDNFKGYRLDNCVPCCYICNYGKNNLTYQEWINYLDNLVNYRKTLIK